MSTQPTDAMIEAGIEAAEKQFWEDVSSHDVKAIYLAMQSARTPPPCAGDDVERVRRAIMQALCVNDKESVGHRWENAARAAIAALGTTPSIVGQEKLDG